MEGKKEAFIESYQIHANPSFMIHNSLGVKYEAKHFLPCRTFIFWAFIKVFRLGYLVLQDGEESQ